MARSIQIAVSLLMVAIIGGGASYAVGRERVRGTDLQALYDQINRDSFRGALPPVSVKWGYLDDAYGRTYYDEEEIVIDRASVTSEGMLRETMRHEACHVATRGVVVETGQDTVNIYTFSGGAEEVTEVLQNNPNLAAAVGTITYLSPGVVPGGSLYANSNDIDTTVYFGNGLTESGVMLSGSVWAAAWEDPDMNDAQLTVHSYKCPHDANCAFSKAKLPPRGPSCKDAKTFTKQKPKGTPSGGGGGGGGLQGGCILWGWVWDSWDQGTGHSVCLL